MRLILCCLLLLGAPAAVHAQVSDAEQAMVRTVAQERDRHIALLERLVNQNSGTLNLAGVHAVGTLVAAELEPLGFAVRWVDMAESGRAGHLIATHPGPGHNVLLIGHLDTVFEVDGPFQTFQREGSRAVGPGIGDDKGGVVVIIAAMRALQASGQLDRVNVTIVLTGDEERIGEPAAVARRDLIAAGQVADYALEFENLAVDDGAEFGTVARRSSTNWTLSTTGRTGHSSGVFNEALGYGAIYEMARILDAFQRELQEPNIVAETAIARGDLRTLTREQDARLRARMQTIVAGHLPRTGATLEFAEGGYPPMAPTEGNRALLARLNAVNRDLGLPLMAEFDPGRRGAADSGFVAGDVDTLGGLGVAGGGAHADGEWIDLDSLSRQALRAAVLVSRLSLDEPR